MVSIVASLYYFNFMNQIGLLPGRNLQVGLANARKIKLTSNLYEIRLDKITTVVYHYNFVRNQKLPLERVMQIFSALSDKQEILYDKIGYLCQYENGFLGTINVEQPIILANELKISNNKDICKLQLQVTKSFDIQELLQTSKNKDILAKVIRPIIDKIIWGKARIKHSTELIGKHKVDIVPQFHFAVVEVQKKFMLSTNIFIKIREHLSVLNYFEKCTPQSAKSILTGLKVMQNYGKHEIFTIQNIDFTKSPTTTMTENKKDCLTFQQYFKEKYSIKITNKNQPLLVVKPQHKWKNNNNKQSLIYLLPEMVSLYRQINPNDIQINFNKKLKHKSMILPQNKEIYTANIIKQLSQIQIIKKSARGVDGYVLEQPKIHVDNKQYTPQDGIFDFRTKLSRPLQLQNWGIVYSISDKNRDKSDVDRLIALLRSVSGQYGIKISNQPGEIIVDGTFDNWKKAIDEDIKTYGTPNIMIFFLTSQEEKYYADIKRYSVMQRKFCSQVIKRQIVYESTKRPMAIASEILVQIQCKIGGIPWSVGKGGKVFSAMKPMCGGLLIDRNQNGYSVTFTGFTNPQNSSIYSYHKGGAEQASTLSKFYDGILMNWARHYVGNCRMVPDTIIFYYMVLSANQKRYNGEIQLAAIKLMIKKIGEKMKLQAYNPQITFIEVCNHQSIQIYVKENKDMSQTVLLNPMSGTVITEGLCGDSYDFYLSSRISHDNTTKPVLYRVIEKGLSLDLQLLIDYTYEQCFCYFNYKGATQLPACLQYAQKLKRLSYASNIQIDMGESLTKTFYFL